MPYTPVRDIELIEVGSLGKETLSNDSFTNLSLGISGAVTIPLAATDVTLTEGTAGQAQHFVLILTGTLTANVNVIVPAESRVYVADNRTTGAFTVTFRPAAGGGVAVDQAARTLIYCDGSNVYPVASGTGGGGGGSGAPIDASYLVGSAHALLTGERAVTNTPTITWDLATAGQAKAIIPPDAVSYTHIQNVTPTRILGRFTAGSGDVQEITPGTGLTLDASGVLSATAVGQPLDATLTALAGVTTAADTMEYFTGVDVAASTPLTPLARTLLDDTTQAAMQGTLALVPGTHVQPADATLTAIAGVTTGADTLPFFTGVDTASTTPFSPLARALLDDTTQAAMQATIGVTGGGGYTDEQAQDAIGAMLADTVTIALSYADATPALTAAIVAGSVGTTQLTDDGVTYAKLQPVTDNRLLGRSAGSAGDAQEISTGTGLTLSGGVLSASGGGGSTTFVALTDTPDTYTGQGGKAVTVKADATGLEFTVGSGDAAGFGAEITRVATFSVPQNTNTILNFDTEVRDDASFWSIAQPSRLTVPTSGWYSLTVFIQWDSSGSNTRITNIRINGTQYIAITQDAAVSTDHRQALAMNGYFTAGDYAEIVLYQTTTGPKTVTGRMAIAAFTSAPAGEMGPLTWLGLTDTPDTYTGAAAQFVRVNAAQTALEFVAQDPELAALSVLVSAADRVPYYTGSGTAALATFTAAGRALVGAADAAAQRTTLALGTLAQQDASAVAITGGTIGGLTTLDVTGVSNLLGRTGIGGGSTPGYTLIVGTGKTVFQDGATVGLNADALPGRALNIKFRKDIQDAIMIQPTFTDTLGGGNLTFFNVAGTIVGRITSDASSTSYATSSDVRLKHAITPLTGALDVVRRLRPITHLWNADGSRGYGFLAHELQREIPDAVSGQPDEVNPDGSIKPQQVDHSKLVPWLTAALQEAVAQIQGLTARVASLEEQLGV